MGSVMVCVAPAAGHQFAVHVKRAVLSVIIFILSFGEARGLVCDEAKMLVC